jgi:hypothetical protein
MLCDVSALYVMVVSVKLTVPVRGISHVLPDNNPPWSKHVAGIINVRVLASTYHSCRYQLYYITQNHPVR